MMGAQATAGQIHEHLDQAVCMGRGAAATVGDREHEKRQHGDCMERQAEHAAPANARCCG